MVVVKFIEHYYAIVSIFADFTKKLKDVILLALIPWIDYWCADVKKNVQGQLRQI